VEKQQKTCEFWLITGLSAKEIVHGKIKAILKTASPCLWAIAILWPIIFLSMVASSSYGVGVGVPLAFLVGTIIALLYCGTTYSYALSASLYFNSVWRAFLCVSLLFFLLNIIAVSFFLGFISSVFGGIVALIVGCFCGMGVIKATLNDVYRNLYKNLLN